MTTNIATPEANQHLSENSQPDQQVRDEHQHTINRDIDSRREEIQKTVMPTYGANSLSSIRQLLETLPHHQNDSGATHYYVDAKNLRHVYRNI